MSSAKKTTTDNILDLIFKEAPEMLTKDEAMKIASNILTLMTKNQRVELLTKAKRCDYYIDAITNKGMNKGKVKSILQRREGITRQSMHQSCKPCDEIMHGNNL